MRRLKKPAIGDNADLITPAAVNDRINVLLATPVGSPAS
jgi:hypothetical protein